MTNDKLYDLSSHRIPQKIVHGAVFIFTGWHTIIGRLPAFKTRGSYIFPVSGGTSAPVSDSNPKNQYVSAYELYTTQFGASRDKVFATQDKHPYVAGEFVWSGWDYLGEPTP